MDVGQKIEEHVARAERERAKHLAWVNENWLSGPNACIAGALRGEAFLMSDKASCMRRRFDVKTMEEAPLTKAEKYEVERLEYRAALMEKAATMIDAAPGNTDAA